MDAAIIMLTYVLGWSTLTFIGLWLLEMRRGTKMRQNLKHRSRMHHAKLANAMIRMRHAFISDIYKAIDISREDLLNEAMEAADLLASTEIMIEKLTAGKTLPFDISHDLDHIQQILERCSVLKDPFFRDTGLFYLAGLLEHGGLNDEALLLCNALKHGTLRAKATHSRTLLLKPSLPDALRCQLAAEPAQPASPSRAATTRKRAASALD